MVGALLIIGPVIVLVFLPTVLGLHRHVVADDAMDGHQDGSIPRGAVALTREVPAADLGVGDVIAFRPPTQDGAVTDSVTRRIVALENGVARTRGDRQEAEDPWALDVTHGTYPRVVIAVPWIGYPFSGGAGRGGWVVLAIASAIALLLSVLTTWFRGGGRHRATDEALHALL